MLNITIKYDYTDKTWRVDTLCRDGCARTFHAGSVFAMVVYIINVIKEEKADDR